MFIGGPEIIWFPLSTLLTTWPLGLWLAYTVHAFRSRRHVSPVGCSTLTAIFVLSVVAAIVAVPFVALLEEWLEVPIRDMGPADFGGPPDWWMYTACLIISACQLIATTAAWFVAFRVAGPSEAERDRTLLRLLNALPTDEQPPRKRTRPEAK